MKKDKAFAREEVMEDYMQSMLTEYAEPQKNTDELNALVNKTDLTAEKIVSDDQQILPADQPPESKTNAASLPELLEDNFQALFFEVAGLTLAVPLITLGGIHNLDKVSPLVGKPEWFKGVMIHREDKYNVVDTVKWVMPEKLNDKLEQGLHYKYLVMLADSEWGLASEKLINTVTLNKDEVKWRSQNGKRPWLAGMVKQRMCALIDVYQLISMLRKGLGGHDTNMGVD